MQLRDYQLKAVDDLREQIRRRCRRLVLVAPTGSGKTVIASDIIKRADSRFRRVLFLAHRRELVDQCSSKLHKFGVEFGVIMSGEFTQMAFEVQVVSIDTLRARAMNSDRMPMPHADLVVIDECHRSLAPTYLKVIEYYDKAVILGLTATPIRSDKKGLGHVYDGMVQCPSISELIRLGHLVPERSFVPTIPDLTGIRIRGGDYDPKELEERLNRRELVGDIVSHWFKYASDRQTVVFASGVRHSMALRDEFARYGLRVAHLDGKTPLTTRQEIIRDLHSNKLQIICNYGVLTEGFDEPRLSACVLARATKNLGLYLQMAGRVLRTHEESHKRDSMIFDHSGNVYEHGYVSDDHDWILTEGKALERDNKERQRDFDERKPICCVNCSAMYEKQMACPNCGHIPERKGKLIQTRHGELVEMRNKQRRSVKKKHYTTEEKELWYRMLLGYAKEHKKKPGLAYHKYKEKFGVAPWSGISRVPMSPSNEVRSWVRAMNIRYAKGKGRVSSNNESKSTG